MTALCLLPPAFHTRQGMLRAQLHLPLSWALRSTASPESYALWAFPVIIGVTRLYVMQHYPTDIIGGFLLGEMVCVVLANVMKLDQPFLMSRFKGKEDQPSQPRGNL